MWNKNREHHHLSPISEREQKFYRTLIKSMWKGILLFLLYSTTITILYKFYHIKYHSLPFMVLGVIGTTLVMFLSFRFRISYDRWWEARSLWEQLTDYSRNYVKQLTNYIGFFNKDDLASEFEEKKKTMIKIHLGFMYAVNFHLTDYSKKKDIFQFSEKDFKEIEVFFPKKHLKDIRESPHIPLSILQISSASIGDLWKKNFINEAQFVLMETTLGRFYEILGGLEKIRWTPIPHYYNLFIEILILVFNFVLPLTLVKDVGYLTIPFSVFYYLLFSTLHSLDLRTEMPFGNRVFDVSCKHFSDLLRKHVMPLE